MNGRRGECGFSPTNREIILDFHELRRPSFCKTEEIGFWPLKGLLRLSAVEFPEEHIAFVIDATVADCEHEVIAKSGSSVRPIARCPL